MTVLVLGASGRTGRRLVGALLARWLEGCDAVASSLGHRTSVRGILGPPYGLVERAGPPPRR